MHRALSWLEKAEQSDDLDSRFIFLWISFNAAYAKDLGSSLRSADKFHHSTKHVIIQKITLRIT